MLVQKEGESIDKFVTRLRERCQVHDTSRELKDQIVQKCTSKRLRRKALRKDPFLEALSRGTRAMELSNAQAAIMEDEANMNRLKNRGEYNSKGNLDNGAKNRRREKRKVSYAIVMTIFLTKVVGKIVWRLEKTVILWEEGPLCKIMQKRKQRQ